MDTVDLMNQCMNMMNSMMGGGMMGNSLLFVVLAVLLLFWLIGLAVLGGVGIWAYRRLRT
jgi:cell division protein FtsB